LFSLNNYTIFQLAIAVFNAARSISSYKLRVVEVWEKRARRDLNPGPPAPEAGAHEASSKLGEGVTPETHDSRFKYSWTPVIIGIRVSRVVVESNKVVLEFDDPDRLSKFIELLRLLG